VPLLSAVVLVRNERDNLPLLLRSLAGWVDEVVVVDGGSTDGTAELARKAGAKVFVRPARGAMEEDGAFAVAQATGEWVLHVDADETIPPRLARRLRQAAEAGEADVVEVREVSHFAGAPCNVWKGHKARLYRREALEMTDRIHGMFKPRSGARRKLLPGGPGMELHHYWAEGAGPVVQRLARYTAVEASQQGPRQRLSGLGMLWRFLRGFLGAYVVDGGIRRGWRGAYLSLHRGFYKATVEARRLEDALGGPDAIRAQYRREAEALLDAAAYRKVIAEQ